MSDSKDFNLSDRRKKVENFEVKIEDTYREQELMEDLMSYSQYEKKMASTHTKGEPRKAQKIRKSVENERFFKRVWIGMILSICLMLGQFVVFGTLDMLAITREDAILKIKIPKGARKCEIVNILHENGVVNQPTFFKLYLFLTKGAQKFIPGTFEVKTNMDYEAIVNYLQSNANRLDSDIIDVTIPEGKNVMEIAEILENNEICSAEEFMNACKSSDYDKQYDFLSGRESTDVEYNLEGYLYPDTYSFYKNVEPKTIIKKFLNNFNNKISKKLFKEDKATVHLVNNEEQNKFLNDLEKCPHAFVLACLMDRQINAERAWAIPYKIYKEVGTFNIYKLKEKGKEYYKELFNKNKFHRFNNDMAEIFYNGICRIIDKY